MPFRRPRTDADAERMAPYMEVSGSSSSADVHAATGTNATVDDGGGGLDGAASLLWWAMFLGLFVVVTLFGNMLVVLSVAKEKHLRSVQNYFIVSLAVADITVGALVMPLAVYVEVMGGRFLLPDALCDAWVAFDVLACTASILNLAAISLDRFMAVTQPLRYQRSIKGSRLYICSMIASSWILSVAIALPIAVGANYTEHRTPGECAFFNPLFVLLSSMGSFFIPTFVMIVLYWKIFRVIKERAKVARVRRKEQYRALNNNAVNLAACRYVCSNGNGNGNGSSNGSPRLATAVADYDSIEQDSPRSCAAAAPTSPCRAGLEPASNAVAATAAAPNGSALTGANGHAEDMNGSDLPPRGRPVDRTQTKATASRTWSSATDCGGLGGGGSLLLVGAALGDDAPSRSREHSPLRSKTSDGLQRSHSEHYRKGDHRERKATITLVVVLCVFLICWIPFFVTNNLKAACLQWHLEADFCGHLSPLLFSFFVWLGYFNSTLNPLIYALLQMEYRRAFAKLICPTKETRR